MRRETPVATLPWALEEGMIRIVDYPRTIDAVGRCHFSNLYQKRSEISVTTQKLSQVVIDLTMAFFRPRSDSKGQSRDPPIPDLEAPRCLPVCKGAISFYLLSPTDLSLYQKDRSPLPGRKSDRDNSSYHHNC